MFCSRALEWPEEQALRSPPSILMATRDPLPNPSMGSWVSWPQVVSISGASISQAAPACNSLLLGRLCGRTEV